MILDGVITNRKDGLGGFGEELLGKLKERYPDKNLSGGYKRRGEFDSYVIANRRMGIPLPFASIDPLQIVQDPKGRRVGLYTENIYSKPHIEEIKGILADMGGQK